MKAATRPNKSDVPRAVAFRRAQELAAVSVFARFEMSPIAPEPYDPLQEDIDAVSKVLRTAYVRVGVTDDEYDTEESAFLYGLALGLVLGRGGAR